MLGVVVPRSGRHKRIETDKKVNNYFCLFNNAEFVRAKMYTKDARITIPGFWSCPFVELQIEHNASVDGSLSCSREKELKCLHRRSSNCNKLLSADIRVGSLFDSSIFHMKTGRVLFSEKLCFRGRL